MPRRPGPATSRKHNLAQESVKRPRILVRMDLCVQLLTLKKVAFIDKERELEVQHLNRKSAYCGLENGQPLGILEVPEDLSNVLAEI